MARILFTADTHFGHRLMARLRGYESVDAMDADLVTLWNAAVRPDDTVWHLGDFSYKAPRSVQSYLVQLNGNLNLVHGNHDGEATRTNPRWLRSEAMAVLQHEGIQLVMVHYPMLAWPGSRRGAVHLHGHTHGRLPGDRQCLDVGIDAWGLSPVTWEQIAGRLAEQPERAVSE
jgi:calcineurin-like phosphoesterase family protein